MVAKPIKRAALGVIPLLLAVTAGCGSNNTSGDPATASPKKQEDTVRSEVKFWYLWNGKEAEYVESLIKDFNASQDKYTVKGLSVPDEQKITIALSSGQGPDITDNFSNKTATLADTGVLEPLDDYIKKSNYDLSDFIPAALQSVQYEGKTYALPINVNFYMMFYNKKLFAEAGISAPPKTDKELLDAAIKLTKVNSDKTINVLGFPDFPNVYYVNPMTFALGGSFASADGKLTPNNPGAIAAINLLRSYREKFGNDNVSKFNASSKYLDATDPFITNKQAIRFDGPWFGNTVKNVLKIDLDYGIAPMPGPDGKPELAGGGEISTSTFFIAKNSKNKDGAWAFMSWLMSKPAMTKFNSMFGNLPARSSVYNDPAFQNIPDFTIFSQAALNKNLKAFPSTPSQIEYGKLISDNFELAVSGKKTAEEALKEAQTKAEGLKQ